MNKIIKQLVVLPKLVLVIHLFFISSSFGQTVSTLVSEFPGDGEISFDSSGNIYVNDSGENGVLNGSKVYKVTQAGDTSLFHSNLPVWVVGSMFDNNGDLLVTGWQAGKISRISADGLSSTIISSGISGAGSLEVDENGNIYVAEYLTSKVLKFDGNGNNETDYAIGFPIQNPAGLAYIETAKKLYVSNWTNNKICVIDSNRVTRLFAEIPEPSVGPIKIFGGYLFATSPQYHKIYKINLQDSTDVQLFAGTGVLGNTDGNIATATFNTPTGIGTLDGETFFISETYAGTGRLRVIKGVTLNLSKERKRKPLKVYPNPSSSSLYISYPYKSSSNLGIFIYSVNGNKISNAVFVHDNGTITCNINTLPAGTYFIKIIDETEVMVTEKFIRQ